MTLTKEYPAVLHNRPKIRLSVIALILLLFAQMPQAATGTLMPSPYQTVFDSNGNPVSGGCVWTYTAGTTTPVATYTDSGLTTPNTNPIVADSAGRFVAWLTSGTSYKFTYEAACTAPVHGSVIRTVDNVLAVPGTSNPTTDIGTVNARCSLTSAVPVTVSDVTAATSVYVEPFKGNRIALYDGSSWNLRTVTETAIAVPATASTIYDVFVYDSASTPTYETLAWTNDTTRATALTTQDGVLSKTGSLTRRYLCSFRTTGTVGQTEDSNAKRYVYNYYNRVRRLVRRTDPANTWTYTTATLRQANANTANQIDVVQGWAETPLDLSLNIYVSNSGGGLNLVAGIGEDSTTTLSANQNGQSFLTILAAAANNVIAMNSRLVIVPAVGRHFYSHNEYSQAAGTTTWYMNDPAGLFSQRGGLIGWWES